MLTIAALPVTPPSLAPRSAGIVEGAGSERRGEVQTISASRLRNDPVFAIGKRISRAAKDNLGQGHPTFAIVERRRRRLVENKGADPSVRKRHGRPPTDENIKVRW